MAEESDNGDDVSILTLLRLRSHCLLCRKRAIQLYNDKSPRNSMWKKVCAVGICESLGIADKPICAVLFKRASFCESCYELFTDFQFIEQSIQRLQKRLQEVTEKTEDLLRINCLDLESNLDITGNDYVQALICLGRELGLVEESHLHKNMVSNTSESEAILVQECNDVGFLKQNDEENDGIVTDLFYSEVSEMMSGSETEVGENDADPMQIQLGDTTISRFNLRRTAASAESMSSVSRRNEPYDTPLKKLRRIAPALPRPASTLEPPTKSCSTLLPSVEKRIPISIVPRKRRLDKPIVPAPPEEKVAAVSAKFRRLAPGPLPQPNLKLPGILMPLRPAIPSSVAAPMSIPGQQPILLATPLVTQQQQKQLVTHSFPVPPIASLRTPSVANSNSTKPILTSPPTPAANFPILLWMPGPMGTGGSFVQVNSGTMTMTTNNARDVTKTNNTNFSTSSTVIDSNFTGTDSDLHNVDIDTVISSGRSTENTSGNTITSTNSNTTNICIVETMGPAVDNISNVVDSNDVNSRIVRSNSKSAKSTVGIKQLNQIRKRVRPLKSLFCSYAPCQFRTASKYSHSMEAHISKVHKNDPAPYHCSDCDQQFRSNCRLESHRSSAHGDLLTCPYCHPTKIFKGQLALIKHKREVHRPAILTQTKCSFCTKICPDSTSLAIHESLHTNWIADGTSFLCVICEANFVTQIQLVRHVNQCHEDEYRLFPCGDCDIKFFTRAKRSVHRLRHKGTKVNCTVVPGCNFATVSEKELKTHYLTHSNLKPFLCTWNGDGCGAKFKVKSSLDMHLAKHQMEEGLIEPKYRCGICSKGFVTTSRYIRHMQAESELRPFLCDRCPRTFKDQNSVNNHIWRHVRNDGKLGNSVEILKRTKARRGTTRKNPLEPLTQTTENEERSNADRDVNINVSCQICDDSSNLFNVGHVTVCAPCKMFYEYHQRMIIFPSVTRKLIKPCLEGNCQVTPTTRSDCTECRLKKCNAVGIKLEDCLKLSRAPNHGSGIRRRCSLRPRQRPPRPPKTSTKSQKLLRRSDGGVFGECAVCLKVSKLIGSTGVSVCNSCKAFFYESVLRCRIFAPCGSSNCQLTVLNGGDYCSSCRYEKCIAVGMNPNAISVTCGKCPVCEVDSVPLLASYEVPACRKCCTNFWVMVRHNRMKECPRNGRQCGGVSKCLGCRWAKYVKLGFKAENIDIRRSKMRERRKVIVEQKICNVCGDVGIHRRGNGYACQGCVTFFYKITAKSIEGICTKDGNCVVDKLTRIDCPPCRFQKCVELGMCRKTRFKKRVEERKDEVCTICDDVAVGNRYGVKSCDSCMYFFMKSSGKDFGQCQDGGNCQISKETRTKCQSCRFAKCLEKGMERTRFAKNLTKRWGKIAKNSAEAESLRRLKIIQEEEESVGPIQSAIQISSVEEEDAPVPYLINVPQNLW